MCYNMPAPTSTATTTTSSVTPDPHRPSTSMGVPGPPPPGPGSSSPATSGPVDDPETATDEVKVFNDEDEREETNVTEKYQQVDILNQIKSNLITDTEQGKSDLRHAFSGHEKFYDPALLMAPYLMNSYAAAAYAANGLANGSLVRSPFLYADPLTSPPPAHLGPHHPGMRPPLYHHLAAAQYPYSMLSADQIAAWHHQAAVYQQNALRASSPYSLPITSSSLPSPMARFSPGGLLGPHPGLSPGLGGHHPHLPLHIKPEPGHHYDRKHSDHHKESSPSKSKKDHIKKPLNAFMLYMKEMRPIVQAECTLKESAAINQILGRRWHSLSREDQAKYYEKARQERQKHLQMYPHWNARDNYRYGNKKKKRKRDKSDDPAASMKKCRARYGLDQQEKWCRPCRRKKKCVRVQSLNANNAAGMENGGGAMVGGHGGHGGGLGNGDNLLSDGSGEKSRHMINNNLMENGKPHGGNGGTGSGRHHNNNFHSDGDEDDEDDDDEEDDDMDDSPPSHQGRNSVESTSEQSLTSPAGFSSLPSIGSPAGSVASPSTPGGGGYDSMANAAAAAVAAAGMMSDPSYWYARSQGAFKPPPPTSSSSAAGSATSASTGTNGSGGLYPHAAAVAAHHQLQALHHYQQQLAAGGLLHRPPVGTDPRDAKNPLSISQLTGNHCSSSSMPHHGGPNSANLPSGPETDAKRTLLGMT